MQYNIKLFEEIDANTSIEWWNENRTKVNEVIRMCNNWAIYHRQDRYYAELVLAKIESIRKWNKDRGDKHLSDWQLKILADIKSHVIGVIKTSL